MCGIIGLIGKEPAAPRILEGLKRLEYRGYDSAGIATLSDGVLDRRRATGKLVNLEKELDSLPLSGNSGIGHTRWATHGRPSVDNAHPHATSKVAVVHNGIIENYAALKEELESYQCRFETETDTEVIAHLVTHYMDQGSAPEKATRQAFGRLTGAFAIVLIFTGHEGLMIGIRKGTPLVVGYGEEEFFLASDSYALAPLTNKVTFLEDGDQVIVKGGKVLITGNDNQPVGRPVHISSQDPSLQGKGGYAHFMLKEIYEQPAVIGQTLNSFVHPSTAQIDVPDEISLMLSKALRVTLVACGTAYYACMVAKYWFEQVARIPCELDIASEFRYREAPMPENGVSLFVSQSGETLDTLEALRYCKRQGQTILSVVNTIESTIERESDFIMRTLAGPEIGVASTKAFTTQLTTLACLALATATKKNVLSEDNAAQMAEALRHVPSAASEILQHDEALKAIAKDIHAARDVLYLGRGTMYPIALEGALKLKEISYIHAEGYAAGELKHGPIALIDDDVPIVVVAPGNDPLFEKTASGVQETVARGGQVLLISDRAGVDSLRDVVRWSIVLDEVHPFVLPILYTIPVQLLAYHTAVIKGTDVDQPRNLAKSVTVE